ncbi:guanyl-specific ribonuclease [Salinifilum ghardaiensis]
MRWITRNSTSTRPLVAALFAAVLVLAPAGAAAAEAPAAGTPAAAAPPAQVAAAPCGDTSEFERVDLSQLPPEAADTVELIQQGGPFPYPQDGQTFENREGILPDCAEGYYEEYTVETPGEDDRGARRFVVGRGEEYFYTADHYESFRLTDINA